MHQGKWLKSLIHRRKMSVKGFAEKSGISRGHLGKLLRQPELSMRPDLMWRILQSLDLEHAARSKGHVREPHYPEQEPEDGFALLVERNNVTHVFRTLRDMELRGELFEPEPAAEEEPDTALDAYTEQPIHDIPLFELSLSAGPWSDVLDVPDVDAEAMMRGLFRVRISGESMAPKYKTGAIVEFQCLRWQDLVAGRDYYVQRSDGSATFKMLEGIEEGVLIFRARNKKRFPREIVVERADITRMAEARWILSRATE